MKNLNSKLLVLAMVIVTIVNMVIACTSTTKLATNDPTSHMGPMGPMGPGSPHDPLFHQERMERMQWAYGYNKIEDEEEGSLHLQIKYEEDTRTGICFAFYRNDFEIVECGFARDGM